MDWRNIQQGVVLPCGFGFTANLGAAVSKGAELEVHYRPLSSLDLGASIAYDEAYVTKAAPGTGIADGDAIQDAPRWAGAVTLDYTLKTVEDGSWFTHWEYQYRDSLTQGGPRTIETSVDPLSGAPFPTTLIVANPAYETRSYRLINASAGLRQLRWGIRAILQNVSNAKPLLNLSAAGPGQPFYTPTFRPRTLRLAFDAEF
jgi:outer membrane receptor protein involved in Fe transport